MTLKLAGRYSSISEISSPSFFRAPPQSEQLSSLGRCVWTSRGRWSGSDRRFLEAGERSNTAGSAGSSGASSARLASSSSSLSSSDLPLDLLRAAPELHAPQLGDQQLQMLDLALVGDQLRVLQTDHRLQGCGIESVQIGQQKRHLAHARSMPHCWVLSMHKRCVNTEGSRMKT